MAFCVHCGEQLNDEGTFCAKCGKSKTAPVASSTGTAAAAVVAVQKTETEKTFLSTKGVTVTNSRVIVPGKTYAMAGITSVRSTVVSAKRGGAIFTAFVGLLFCLNSSTRAFGVVVLIIGVVWAFSLKDQYALALSSASGEVHAVVSKDSSYIASIVVAVNEAIVYRS